MSQPEPEITFKELAVNTEATVLIDTIRHLILTNPQVRQFIVNFLFQLVNDAMNQFDARVQNKPYEPPKEQMGPSGGQIFNQTNNPNKR